MRKPRLTKDETEEHSIKECPIFLTLTLIANKWSIRILGNLLNTPKNTLRFNQLKHAMNGISQRELTKHLREFEKSGIVTRMVYAEMPLRVEYTLTKLGKTLCDPIQALSNWADKYGASVYKMRQEFESRKKD
jgi:DNA-binding HxlR family transcriptional regulator